MERMPDKENWGARQRDANWGTLAALVFAHAAGSAPRFKHVRLCGLSPT